MEEKVLLGHRRKVRKIMGKLFTCPSNFHMFIVVYNSLPLIQGDHDIISGRPRDVITGNYSAIPFLPGIRLILLLLCCRFTQVCIYFVWRTSMDIIEILYVLANSTVDKYFFVKCYRSKVISIVRSHYRCLPARNQSGHSKISKSSSQWLVELPRYRA